MDYLNGKEVKVQNGKETFSGTATGIDKAGELIIKLKNGRKKLLTLVKSG